MPFEKHILFWDAPKNPAKGGVTRAALHADEGVSLASRMACCVGSVLLSQPLLGLAYPLLNCLSIA